MASDGGSRTVRVQHGSGGQALKLLVQNIRGDLNLLSNEAKKKHPAVREAAERGAMKLKTLSETPGFSLKVLAENDVAIHPLLFACETKNPVLVRIALSALQRLIQNKAIPQKSIDSIVATLKLLMENYLEELKIIQTVLLLVTTTEVVQGKSLLKVLMLCFKMYSRSSREPVIHNTAGVAIRQIMSAMFERLNNFIVEKGLEEVEELEKQALPMQAKDAYLLFQDVCFLTNGDPPAWLPPSIDLELSLGLELLETVLRAFPRIFVREKLFNQLLTERVCPLIIKLFSPTSKYRQTSLSHSPTTSTMLAADKPTFSLSIRLLRILNVLIREFYFCLITQCEIFLSMLVKFLDSDKPLWQRTLAVEVLHSFCNHPRLLKSFCECYDMQEHSTKVFGDIIDAVGGFIQSYFTSHMVHISYGIMSSSATTGVTNNSSTGHMTSSISASGRPVHIFSVKSTSVQVESLPSNAHNKPVYLEMLDKSEVPVIADGYPLVVAMNALLNAIKSVSLVINDEMPPSPHSSPPPDSQIPALTPGEANGVNEVMLKSSWSGVLAALALLLDACADEQTTLNVLEAHRTYIYLCGMIRMTSSRDAFLTSLCKAALPPKYAMSLITQRSSTTKKRSSSSSNLSQRTVASSAKHSGQRNSGVFSSTSGSRMESYVTNEGAPPTHIMPSAAGRNRSSTVQGSLTVERQRQVGETGGTGSANIRRKLNLSESGAAPAASSEMVGESGTSLMGHRSIGGGVSVSGGGMGTPVKEQQSGLVTLKNLQCIQCLLHIIDHLGNYLDTAWLLIMNAAQHIFEMFGLKPLSGGGFKLSGISENSSLSLVSVEKRKEISEVAENLKDLFKCTKQLSDPNVLHLITALSQLSSDTSLSTTARENGLFPVTALLEVGCTNYSRLQLIWPPITSHLSKVCSHSDSTLRAFATDALTSLIRGALEQHTKEDQDVQSMLLMPLESLTAVKHQDVRQKQLDCISHVLHSIGHSLHSSWSIILDVISSATTLQSETLTRAGFQCLQLVIADFLPAIPPSCVPVCVDVGGAYGIQTQDINISLTSIGLLWNMADYLYQNKSSLQDSLEALRTQPTVSSTSSTSTFIRTLQNSSLSVFDSVWMLLFKHLSELCVDERAAVRKSACQTLFSTISAHGVLLQKDTWKGVLWQVLFPLLEGVDQAAGAASTSSFETAILIHHSRDTEQKQWAETQVLALTGTCRLFQSQWSTLTRLDSFERAWNNILDSIQTCACNSSSEVSIAAMKGFQTIIDHQPTVLSSPHSSVYSLSPIKDLTPSSALRASPEKVFPVGSVPNTTSDLVLNSSSNDALSDEVKDVVWTKAWHVWQSIGTKCVCERLPKVGQFRSLLKSQKTQDVDIFFHGVPSQSFLVHLLQVFPFIFTQLMSKFGEADFKILSRVLHISLLMPVAKDVSPFLVPSNNESLMTSVHKLVVKCLSVIFTNEDVFESSDASEREELARRQSGPLLSGRKGGRIDMKRSITLHSVSHPKLVTLYQYVINELLKYSAFSCQLPEEIRLTKGIPPGRLPMISVNYVPIGLGSMSLAVQLYCACIQSEVEIPKHIVVDFLKTLHTPLKLKHRCSQPTIWMQSVDALLLILEAKLPQILQKGEASLPFWKELAAILNDFLFNDVPDGTELSMEKMREYEALDIKVIEVIKRDILTVSTEAPKEFLGSLTSILNRGSIHSATDQIDGGAQQLREAPFRENFARVCFEALLQFSFLQSKESAIATDSTTQLALNALLERCEEVLLKFVADERLSGACPLPRSRMNEVSLVLKSVTVLITTLKDAQKSSTAKIDATIWQHVAKLYPALVQCVTCNSAEVRLALREALYQFTDLVSPWQT